MHHDQYLETNSYFFKSSFLSQLCVFCRTAESQIHLQTVTNIDHRPFLRGDRTVMTQIPLSGEVFPHLLTLDNYVFTRSLPKRLR
jgi:hypothetical protein